MMRRRDQPPGFLRRQQADRLHADLHQLDVEDAAVLPAVGIEQQEAAALDDAGIDGESRARGRLEAPGRDGAWAAAEQVVHVQLGAQAIDRTSERPYRDLERAGDLHVDLIQARAFRQFEVEEGNLNGTVWNLFERDGGLEAGAVFQSQARDVADETERQRDFDTVADHRAEQRIVADLQYQLAVLEIELDLRCIVLQADAARQLTDGEVGAARRAEHERCGAARSREGDTDVDVAAEIGAGNRRWQR
jgi:hypothetical protein